MDTETVERKKKDKPDKRLDKWTESDTHRI